MDMDTDGYAKDRRRFFHTDEAQNQFYISFNLTKPLYILIKNGISEFLRLGLSFSIFFTILEARSGKLLISLQKKSKLELKYISSRLSSELNLIELPPFDQNN